MFWQMQSQVDNFKWFWKFCRLSMIIFPSIGYDEQEGGGELRDVRKMKHGSLLLLSCRYANAIFSHTSPRAGMEVEQHNEDAHTACWLRFLVSMEGGNSVLFAHIPPSSSEKKEQ